MKLLYSDEIYDKTTTISTFESDVYDKLFSVRKMVSKPKNDICLQLKKIQQPQGSFGDIETKHIP